ncbi:MAG: SufE family protein [Paracoccus sp. (in: a-proteobacteria)]|nr:SufE family protein [Paracoccus sp. (in: a-proteobacteria)]
MTAAAFEEIVADFEFMDDWEDRYRHLIELGRAMPPMAPELQVPATKVEGCASQVWILPRIDGGRLDFVGDSDAMIVRGLIAVLHALVAGERAEDIAALDFQAQLARLGLDAHLSSQRSNGLRAMTERLRAYAQDAA